MSNKPNWQRAPDTRGQPRMGRLQVLRRQGKASEAQWDTTALLVARLKDEVESAGTGGEVRTAVGNYMGEMMADNPERLAQVTLALLAITVRLTDNIAALQGRPGGFMAFVDHMIDRADREAG